MMKKLLLFLGILSAAVSAHAFNPVRQVQISTNSLSQQTGSFNVSGGTMTTAQITTLSGVKSITGTDSITFSTGTITFSSGTISTINTSTINTSGGIIYSRTSSVFDLGVQANNREIELDSVQANMLVNLIPNSNLGASLGDSSHSFLNVYGSTMIVTSAGSTTAPSLRFSNDSTSGMYSVGTSTIGITAGGTTVINAGIGGVGVKGTITNDEPRSGDYGQFFSSATNSATSVATTAQWGDILSTGAVSGDWDVEWCATELGNGATVTRFQVGISSVSGNSTTNLIQGVNQFDAPILLNGVRGASFCFTYRIQVAANTTTTWYFKEESDYTVATPQISASYRMRRAR